MLIDVVDVKVQSDFTLLLKFENGEMREFDCKTLFDKKPYHRLKEKEFFQKAKNVFGTVMWSDEIDISPETLYFESRIIK
ncbi:MAG: DUF2442 domain-containing protein [Epsilonproteobacteria bacterium]|nr:DUF2442 domain-containing protein [Campylobacterota bacterium]